MTRLFIAALLLFAARALAGDVLPLLKTVNAAGTLIELRDVHIVKVEADGVRVMHSSGTAKVPFERLPEDLQLKYGFDPAKAYQSREAAQESSRVSPSALSANSNAASATQSSEGTRITKEGVKALWLRECQQCFICPSDPQYAAKKQALAQRVAAIRSGAWDGKAEQYAQKENTRAAGTAGK
jgi:hypothetical protein